MAGQYPTLQSDEKPREFKIGLNYYPWYNEYEHFHDYYLHVAKLINNSQTTAQEILVTFVNDSINHWNSKTNNSPIDSIHITNLGFYLNLSIKRKKKETPTT